MAETSNIAWTDATMNFWIGCQEVSSACDFCYAKELAERYGWAKWGAGEPRHRTAVSNWRKPYQWDRKAAKDGVRLKVFTNSLADFFDNAIDPAWRAEAWDIIAETPNLDWLILTKRPQNIKKMLPPEWSDHSHYDNVWLGTTVENQDEAKRRIPHLVEIPAAVHFLSVEPMLGPVDIREWCFRRAPENQKGTDWDHMGINWVICGGESGEHRRNFDLTWAEDLKQQCAEKGVPFFFKQDSAFKPGQRGRASDDLWGTKQMPLAA